MEDNAIDLKDLQRRMDGTISVLRTELASLRTGRASAALLEPISAEVYGSYMPLNQLATISVPEPRMISVQVWDKAAAQSVEKAIRESPLGLNPIVEGQLFRIPIPELNEERRLEMIKVAHKYAEQAKVAVRHVRRDGMEHLKRAEKDHKISQDEHHEFAHNIQTLTDSKITDIDSILTQKEGEIAQV